MDASSYEGELRNFTKARLRLARASVEGGDSLAATFPATTELAAEAMRVERCGIWLFVQERRAIRCYDVFEQSRGSHSEGTILHVRGLSGVLRGARRDARRPGRRRAQATRDERAGGGVPDAARDRLDARRSGVSQRPGRGRRLPRARRNPRGSGRRRRSTSRHRSRTASRCRSRRRRSGTSRRRSGRARRSCRSCASGRPWVAWRGGSLTTSATSWSG